MKRVILLLIVNWILLTCLPLGRLATAYATIHYVKHGQGNIPPYLTWQTAADSIMWAINVSQFGDTIYVANGIYKEQIVMIPGLSLIGSGMDSCVIDTRDLADSTAFVSVEIADSCLLTGFQIMVYYNSDRGYAISGGGNNLITLNKVSGGGLGTYIASGSFVYKNVYDNVDIGIWFFNSNSIARGNIIYTDPNAQYTGEGILIMGFTSNYSPLIDSNYIFATNSYGIKKSYGARPTIRNNTIILNDGGLGLLTDYSDSAFVYNNLFISINGYEGIENPTQFNLKIYNNYFTGNFSSSILFIGQDNTVKNNVITNGASKGVEAWSTQNLTYQYNDAWNNAVNYSGFTPDSTNISVDPMIMNGDTTQGNLDFHLQKYSPLIDRGDPTIKDKDLTRSDIGLYGGPWGEAYKYIDLPPHSPVNFTAVDSNGIFLSWNRNTEADTSYYNVYRDTSSNFTIDSTKLIGSPTDTFFTDIIPPGVSKLVYKVTAVDKQGNESQPSEEQEIILTGIINKPIIVKYYRLYQNYPNPFNPITKIGYRLKESGYVKLYVYDIKGALLETLVNQYQEGGYYEVTFSANGISASGGNGKQLSSGVYIYQLMVRGGSDIPVFSDIKKMVLIK